MRAISQYRPLVKRHFFEKIREKTDDDGMGVPNMNMCNEERLHQKGQQGNYLIL
jgi:hypothetical protein